MSTLGTVCSGSAGRRLEQLETVDAVGSQSIMPILFFGNPDSCTLLTPLPPSLYNIPPPLITKIPKSTYSSKGAYGT